MNKILKLFTIFLSCSLFLSCGYKVVNKMNKNDYSISEITTTGAPRISFIIKNRLLYTSSKESKNIFNLSINTNKKRIVKNKNIKNEVTDYELVIDTQVKYTLLGEIGETKFSINKSGSYKVSDQRINTINNEKRILETLTNNIINQIIARLNKKINDN